MNATRTNKIVVFILCIRLNLTRLTNKHRNENIFALYMFVVTRSLHLHVIKLEFNHFDSTTYDRINCIFNLQRQQLAVPAAEPTGYLALNMRGVS